MHCLLCRQFSPLIQKVERIEDPEMFFVFNMGIGFCAIVGEADADLAVSVLGSRKQARAKDWLLAVGGRATANFNFDNWTHRRGQAFPPRMTMERYRRPVMRGLDPRIHQKEPHSSK